MEYIRSKLIRLIKMGVLKILSADLRQNFQDTPKLIKLNS